MDYSCVINMFITSLNSADCCHQQAKITVVDLAGNVGLCDVVITPGFVAPDPKLCTAPSNVVSTYTRTNFILQLSTHLPILKKYKKPSN